jgi:hypothetical protein
MSIQRRHIPKMKKKLHVFQINWHIKKKVTMTDDNRQDGIIKAPLPYWLAKLKKLIEKLIFAQ